MSLMMSMMTASSTPPAETDPYIVNYSTLLHCNGLDGSTTLIDQSEKLWTLFNGAQIDTAQSKFGGASLLLNGSGAHATTPSHEDFNFGDGEFTITCQVYFNALADSKYQGIIARDQIGGTRGWLLFTADNSQPVPDAISFAGWVGGTPFSVADTVPATTGAFIHIAVVRDKSSGDVLRLFKNGIQVASVNITGSIGAPNEPCVIGSLWNIGVVNSGSALSGWVDEVRITKGQAVYRSNFTPPTQPYVDGHVTSLLLFAGANGSSVFTDEKGNPWTAFGQAQIDTSLGYNTGLFDGNLDYLSSPSSSNFGFGAGDFTVDALIATQDVDAYQPLLDTRTNVLEGVGLYAYGSSGGGGADYRKMLYVNNAAILGRSTSNVPNTLVHLAYVRSGSTIKMFINGVEQPSVTDARTMAKASPAFIGCNYTIVQFLNARIKAFRITKAVARWTTNFTPPTSFPNS